MAAELDLQVQDSVSRDQRIRDLFASLGGGMGTREFVRVCRRVGIWSQEEWDGFAIDKAQAVIRRAFKTQDAAGLPFAGITTERTEDGAPVWQQRPLWTYDDYALNIAELIAQRNECDRNAARLAAECAERFGRSPDISPLEDRRS